jgi:hypothetical protein
MSRLSRRAQWGVVIGLYFGDRVIRNLAEAYPNWKPFLYPILILYAGFTLLTWLGQPVFNLLLRLNRFGRLALSSEQISSSNWVGLCLLTTAAFGVWSVATGSNPAFLAALVCGLLTLPISATFGCSPGWPRRTMAAYTALLALVGGGAVAALLFLPKTGAAGDKPPAMFTVPIALFFIGTFLAAFVANALAMARPKR